jgi:hypothetical protein
MVQNRGSQKVGEGRSWRTEQRMEPTAQAQIQGQFTKRISPEVVVVVVCVWCMGGDGW